ncbi:fibrobacter succinogenes major paralogous domain-containing protein [Candidatus Saccharibacteria bacterium]|nr:fibrobacter succinogenes major paralogous domain-containing protein [Candidatus Saccharibacteria bacterium]
MKSMKKCIVTKEIISKSIKLDKRRSNKRRSSAGMFYTSSAGAVTSLILITTLSFLTSAFLNLTGTSQAHATASTINISVVDNVSLSILPTSTSGTFATSDTSTNNISVSTTNGTGYTLGIKASAEGSNALNGANSTSIPSHTVSAGISEATYSTDSTYNNTWGYRPSKLNSTANSNYLPGPTSASTAITLDKTTSANPTSSNNYNLAIGVRVDGNTAAGAYSNTFIITVVANPSVYSITYNKNTTDTVSNMPTNVVNQETSSETVTLANNTPTRTGYNLQDWCTVQVADGAACTGTSYSPGSTWTIDQTASTNSLTLYARWKLDKVYIQDFTKANCQAQASSADFKVYDKRDENDYTVHYINGECWMTQNLRFTGASLKVGETNVTSNRTISPYGALTSGDSYTEARKQYNNNTNYGAYYNFCAASAKTVCDYNTQADATQDICPAGWKLPTQAQIQTIADNKGANWNAVVAGYYSGGSLSGAGTYGYWWASTANSATAQYNLYYSNLYGFDFWNVSSYGKARGFSVRCVRAS